MRRLYVLNPSPDGLPAEAGGLECFRSTSIAGDRPRGNEASFLEAADQWIYLAFAGAKVANRGLGINLRKLIGRGRLHPDEQREEGSLIISQAWFCTDQRASSLHCRAICREALNSLLEKVNSWCQHMPSRRRLRSTLSSRICRLENFQVRIQSLSGFAF